MTGPYSEDFVIEDSRIEKRGRRMEAKGRGNEEKPEGEKKSPQPPPHTP